MTDNTNDTITLETLDRLEDVIDDPSKYSLIEMAINSFIGSDGLGVTDAVENILGIKAIGLGGELSDEQAENFLADALKELGVTSAQTALDDGNLSREEAVSILAEIGNNLPAAERAGFDNHVDADDLAKKHGFYDNETLTGLAVLEQMLETSILDNAEQLKGLASRFNDVFNTSSTNTVLTPAAPNENVPDSAPAEAGPLGPMQGG
jgi:hypothetical protein